MLVKVLLGLVAVFLMMAVVLLFFLDRISILEDRRKALLLAGELMVQWESGDAPAVGVHDSTAVTGDACFMIRRVVIERTPGVREMKLIISRDDRRNLELTRNYYEIGNNGMTEWRRI